MGFFSYLFGTDSQFSDEYKSISREDIRVLVSRSRVRTLDGDEEKRIEEAIENARLGGGISLRKIDTVLRSLVSNHTISIHDKKGVMKQFKSYFEK